MTTSKSRHTSRLTTLFACLLGLFFATGCSQKGKTTISGHISGAEDKTIYLEAMGLTKSDTIASAKISGDGYFKFTEKLPRLPEFYRLKLDDQMITLGIDSISHIEVTADYNSFATGYSVSGSPSSTAIKEIFLAQLDANVGISKNIAEHNAGAISDSAFYAEQAELIENYKEVALKFIYKEPGSLPAYFALFQEVGGNLIFNIFEKDDSRAFGAVATSYDMLYPETERAKHLHDIALYSMAMVRAQRQTEVDLNEIANVKETGIIEIELPNLHGDTIALSDACKDKVCLLSFTAMGVDWINDYNQMLDDLYKTYAPKGFTIYQVGLERDGHIWKNHAAKYDWINVQDNNAQFSRYVGLYNLHSLPTLFVINKKGEIEASFQNPSDAVAYISKMSF